MKNKKCKQMIVDVTTNEYGFSMHTNKFFFFRAGLMFSFVTESEYQSRRRVLPFKYGVVSLTANQLRGK